MKKIFLTSLLTLSILVGTASFASAKEQPKNENDYTKCGELSPEKRAAANAKLEEVEKYINMKNSKEASKTRKKRSFGDYKILDFPANAQEKGTWCGPAAAENAIKGVDPSSPVTQYALATWYLRMEPGKGTIFPGTWVDTLNNFLPNNNYQVLLGGDYSQSEWTNKVKNSVIYTVDKGYGVVIDTIQQKTDSYRLISDYSYVDGRNEPVYHYIVACGYDDTSGEDRIYFSDSNTRFPGKYWTETSIMAHVSKPFGIIW